MICPYCNTEMEPIDLAGKVFCSNCGMTISGNNPKKQEETPAIIHLESGSENEINPPTKKTSTEEVINNDYVPETPETKPLVPEDESGKVKDELMKLMEEEKPDIPEIKTNIARQEPAQKDTDEAKTPPIIEPVKIPVENKDIKLQKETPEEPSGGVPESSHPVVTNDLSDSQLGVDLPKNKPTKNFEEKVKEIDTLGASGVLLDILDDTALEKQKEEQLVSLKAAKSLVDDLRFDSENKSDTTKAAQGEQGGKPEKTQAKRETEKTLPKNKPDSNENKPHAPVFTPEEIEAALTGKELPKKEPISKPTKLTSTEKDRLDAIIKTTAEDLNKEQAYSGSKDVTMFTSSDSKSTAVKDYFNNLFNKKA